LELHGTNILSRRRPKSSQAKQPQVPPRQITTHECLQPQGVEEAKAAPFPSLAPRKVSPPNLKLFRRAVHHKVGFERAHAALEASFAAHMVDDPSALAVGLPSCVASKSALNEHGGLELSEDVRHLSPAPAAHQFTSPAPLEAIRSFNARDHDLACLAKATSLESSRDTPRCSLPP
jgi:hypothetical protein